MTQCDFFIVGSDEMSLVEWIVSKGAWLVPSLDYEKRAYSVAASCREYLDFKDRSSLFFVLHPSFYRCPLELRAYSSGPKSGKFFLLQRNGGPAISLFVPPVYEEDSVKRLPPGMVAYYPTFLNPESHENEAVPNELIVFFGNLLHVIKGGAYTRDVASRTYWVSRAAMEKFRSGSLQPGLEITL